MTKRDGTMMAEEGPAWAECPHPERWSAWTYQGVEVEVARWLASTVAMLKPDVVVDTGTGSGVSATHLAFGCRDNGFGHVYSQDVDALLVGEAEKVRDQMGLTGWLTCRVGGDVIDLCDHYGLGEVDLFFCDAGTPYESTRYDEIVAMVPRMSDRGVMIAHDTSPAWGAMRPRIDSLDIDGVVQLVHLPTPRGLTIMRVVV